MRPATLALPLVLATAAACSQPAERPLASAHNEGVVVEHEIDNFDEARHVASGQCANFGKQPRLRQILPQPTGRQFAVFDCLP